MHKLILPSLGAALMLGVPVASAQLMLPGQPGYTSNNRSLAPGVTAPSTPSPYQTGPVSAAGPQPSPRFGLPGDLNRAEYEAVAPGEPDASGKIGPTVDRSRARFAGERDSSGKLLPTYLPSQAQAQMPQSATPQTPAQTDERMRGGQTPPAPRDMQNRSPNQPPMNQRGQPDRRSQMAPGSTQSGQSGQSQMGQTDQSQQRDQSQMQQRRMQSGSQGMQGHGMTQQQRDRMNSSARQGAVQPPDATAILNTLSAQGYRPTSAFRKEGKRWATTAMKDGRQVTVLYDPSTRQVSEQ